MLDCEKLGISADGCKVVLEEDGSEIEDDETLQAYEESVLMILQPGEKWSSASEQAKQAAPEQKKPDEGTSKPLHPWRQYVRSVPSLVWQEFFFPRRGGLIGARLPTGRVRRIHPRSKIAEFANGGHV